MQAELYKGVEWPEVVRAFYAETLRFYGFRAENRRAFDRFVFLMEERMADFLTDSRLDHSGLGLVREEQGDA